MQRPRWFSWLLGFAILIAVTLIAAHSSEERAVYKIAREAQPWWLLAAFVLQAATYVSQGEIWRVVTRASGVELSWRTASWLSVGKLFVDQALPSGGISGNVLMVRALEQRQVPRPIVMAAVVIDTASCYASYVLGLGVALAITFVHHQASSLVLYASLPFGLGAIALTVAVIAWAGSGPGVRTEALASRFRPLRTVLEIFRTADARLCRRPDLLAKACGYQLGILALDAATIWTLVASLGARATPSGVFASFMISTVFRIIGIAPGGLGAFEAASVLTLKAIGVALPVALAATLLFRGVSSWLPMLPGAWLARRALLSARSSGLPTDAQRRGAERKPRAAGGGRHPGPRYG